jgi:hypothetical protein
LSAQVRQDRGGHREQAYRGKSDRERDHGRGIAGRIAADEEHLRRQRPHQERRENRGADRKPDVADEAAESDEAREQHGALDRRCSGPNPLPDPMTCARRRRGRFIVRR